MPYIVPERRIVFDKLLLDIHKHIENNGEFNYCLSKLTALRLNTKEKRYEWMSALHGVLTDVADEFHDCVMYPYERNKERQNGSVYERL